MRKPDVLIVLLAAVWLPAAWSQSSVPVIFAGGTVNAADYSRAVAPGALISVFGSNLASGTDLARGLPLPTEIAGASIVITDGTRTVNAPLYYASPGQINGQLPYDLTGPTIQVQVKNAAGTSNADQLTIVPHAPRIFTVTVNGTGRAILVHSDYQLSTRTSPAKPGEDMIIYLNGLGAVQPPVPAGAAPGDDGANGPLNRVTDPVNVTVNNNTAHVDYAGLAPRYPGLYQVNFRMPYDNVAGDVSIVVSVGSGQSQADLTIPVEPNGFYWAITAGKTVNGETLTGASGTNSDLAFRQSAASTWGQRGLNAWTKDTGLEAGFAPIAGVALTLKNGGSIVFDNNGIETGTQGDYYNNQGGVPDQNKPGLYVMYSMSNYLSAIWGGYFHLTKPTTFDQIIGYFDGNGQHDLPFDPANVYNRYRMNIWSNNPANMPTETGNFSGDVFSSDNTPGTFAFSDTSVKRVFQDGSKDPIYRLVYTLQTPITLPAGEYWFSHDVAVPDTSPVASGSTSARPAVQKAPAGNRSFAPVRPPALFTHVQ